MIRQFLIDYSEDVLAGDVVACKKHKQACTRFLRDIEREGTDDFPYIFDEDRASRFLEWMTLFKHTQGVLAEQHIQPHEIQVFVFGNIYGWKHRDTGYRRFRFLYWQVAKKNAKSQSLACVGTYETFAFVKGKAEVYCAATKKDQSKIIWEEAQLMLDACEELQGKYSISYGAIRHNKTGSTFKALSKEDRKKGVGKNPQCGIIDEYHEHETDEMLSSLKTGVIARPEPLIPIITTAGLNLNAPCYRVEYDFVSRLLDPDDPTEDDAYFGIINELDKDEEGNLIDDISDEKSWEKANPIVCSYPEGIANLRIAYQNAINKPDEMDKFLTKNMNVWVSGGKKKYMRMDKWAACGRPEEIPDLRGLECTVGIDLSSKIDLTSVGFEFELPNGLIVVKSHSFMPENVVIERSQKDKVPYDLWVRQGWITATPGDVVDYDFIKSYIKARIEKDGWVPKEFCYDPYNATQFATDMQKEEGFVMVEIRQGVKTLSEPTKDFREMTYSNRIIHDKNPVLSWAIGNAVTRKDHNENIMLDKEKSTNRIDPIASLINAHVRVKIQIDERSVYEKRGMRSLLD